MRKFAARSAIALAAAGLVCFGSASTASADERTGGDGVTCPMTYTNDVPTNADYLNAWNNAGACLGAGAAEGLSAAWAGAFPTIVGGALNTPLPGMPGMPVR
ncbi:hypothetical protein EV193_110150 [Herbihabitans rhizosphaerae]|uniref:Secreted protein n=1 Tax=Herbihabitans rhizosphaerae TaxID=1872711 RepID=A0A4Q7KGM6_9PSEU|nr:hypothetical protein [Herbihabitans rhizosphaerae]RZS34000.1 hypothetical protein EV193_110150 [Herbihabitans rhizosphaerae]